MTPKKYPQNLHIPPKIFSFLKNPKILRFKILNPKISPILPPPPLQPEESPLFSDLKFRTYFFCLAPLIKVPANGYYQIKGHLD